MIKRWSLLESGFPKKIMGYFQENIIVYSVIVFWCFGLQGVKDMKK